MLPRVQGRVSPASVSRKMTALFLPGAEFSVGQEGPVLLGRGTLLFWKRGAPCDEVTVITADHVLTVSERAHSAHRREAVSISAESGVVQAVLRTSVVSKPELPAPRSGSSSVW